VNCRRVAKKIKAYGEIIVQNLPQTGSAIRYDYSFSVLRGSPPLSESELVVVYADAAPFSSSRRMGLAVGVVIQQATRFNRGAAANVDMLSRCP
jgi:hypothetical protein